jgi:hypothetical protein
MAQDQLQKFFQEKKEKAKPADIDWGAKRDAWVAAVNDLYHTIEDDYLKAAKGNVEIERETKEVRELYIGVYQVPELFLRVGDEEVEFSPVGTIVAGAQGRIDLEGERDNVTIVWQGGNRWSIVASRAPLRLIDLTADSLADVLKAIMRP